MSNREEGPPDLENGTAAVTGRSSGGRIDRETATFRKSDTTALNAKAIENLVDCSVFLDTGAASLLSNLIDALDALDGDTDLEPSLGWPQRSDNGVNLIDPELPSNFDCELDECDSEAWLLWAGDSEDFDQSRLIAAGALDFEGEDDSGIADSEGLREQLGYTVRGSHLKLVRHARSAKVALQATHAPVRLVELDAKFGNLLPLKRTSKEVQYV